MTNQEEPVFPYYRSPSSIRGEVFSRRMRGLDEAEVREYLDLIADQVQAADNERAEIRAENERLRVEIHRARSELAEQESSGEGVNAQAVALFSQAQLVAEEMVEEVTRDARARLMQARAQEREILQEAHDAAAAARKNAEAAMWTPGPGPGDPATRSLQSPFGRDTGRGEIVPSSSTPELENVRSFARVAQAQMQSIMDALAAQMEKLGDAPPSGSDPGPNATNQDGMSFAAWRTWHVDSPPGDHPDSWTSG